MLAAVLASLALQATLSAPAITDETAVQAASLIAFTCLEAQQATASRAQFVSQMTVLRKAPWLAPYTKARRVVLDVRPQGRCVVSFKGSPGAAQRLGEAFLGMADGCARRPPRAQSVTCSKAPAFRLETTIPKGPHSAGDVDLTLIDLRP